MNNLRITIANGSENRKVTDNNNNGAKPKGNWKTTNRKGRKTGGQPAPPRRSANERLMRAPNEPTKVVDLREKLDVKNNNEDDEDVEMNEIQALRRTDTSNPNCICVREIKMVVCR